MVVSSSTLVNVSDDAEVRLVSLLAEGAPGDLLSPTFQVDCQRSIEGGQAGALLMTVLNDVGAMTALLTVDLDEAVAAFSLLAALLERAERPATDLVHSIVNIALPESEERKINLLATLYNMRSDVTEKVDLLQQMIQLAGSGTTTQPLLAPEGSLGRLLSCPGDEESALPSANNGRCLDPSQPPLVALLDSWQVQDRTSLYATIVSVLSASDIRRQRFLLLLVASYTDAKAAAVSDPALEAAKEVAVGAIRDPVSLFILQRNMLSWPAISQGLAKKYPILLQLLKVFQEGTVADYNALLQANGGAEAVLGPYSLDAESCARNMRILTLCSIANDHDEIPYAQIAQSLQLPSHQSEDVVETWVIAAVTSGLLQAKMDQLQHKVLVERSVVRKFDMEQWKVLQARLRMWKQNVGSVLSALKESHQEGSAATLNSK